MIGERHLGAASVAESPRPHSCLSGRAGLELTTRTGFTFEVRSANEADEPALAEFFSDVTKEDLRFRFLTTVKSVGNVQLDLLTHPDHRRTESFVALDMGVGCVLASAILAADEGLERAEVAIVVRSQFKDRGIGWRLLEYVSERAAAMGVKTLQSLESQDNHSAIELERAMGFHGRACPGDSTLLILEKSLVAAPRVTETIPA